VDQDHVFAVTGRGDRLLLVWLSDRDGHPPTYGFNTTGGWAGPPNFFGSDGRCSATPASCGHLVPAKQAKAKSVALLAYNVSASSDLCATAARLLKSAGLTVSYVDFECPY